MTENTRSVVTGTNNEKVFHKTVVTSDQLTNKERTAPKGQVSAEFKLPSELAEGSEAEETEKPVVEAKPAEAIAEEGKEETTEEPNSKDKRKDFLAKAKAEREYREKESKLKLEAEKVAEKEKTISLKAEKAEKFEEILKLNNPIALIEAAGFEWDDVIDKYIKGEYKRGATKPEPTPAELASEQVKAEIKAFKEEQAKAKEEEAKQKDIEKQEALEKKLQAFQQDINKEIDTNSDKYPICKGEELGEVVLETWKQATINGQTLSMQDALEKVEQFYLEKLGKYKGVLLKEQGNKPATDKPAAKETPKAAPTTKKTLSNKLGMNSADIVSAKHPSHANKDEWTKHVASKVKLSWES